MCNLRSLTFQLVLSLAKVLHSNLMSTLNIYVYQKDIFLKPFTRIFRYGMLLFTVRLDTIYPWNTQNWRLNAVEVDQYQQRKMKIDILMTNQYGYANLLDKVKEEGSFCLG